MNLSLPAKPLNVLVMHGPELGLAGLDPQDFSRAVADLPNCRVLLADPALPTAQQEERVRTFLSQDQEINPVVLVAKDPEYRGAGMARLLTGELGLNPERLKLVDLTAALEHPDQPSRTAKGLEMIRLAASQVTRAWPIVPQAIPVSRQVLVWGDSSAGLEAAWQLAQLGYPVILASPNPELKPLALVDAGDAAESDSAARLVRQVQGHRLISTVFAAKLSGFDGATGNFTLRLDTPQGPLTEPVGAVLLAPELHLRDALPSDDASKYPGVVSQTWVEELLAGGSGQKIPETAAILVGLDGESNPLALGRALRAASRLLEVGSRVYLLVGNAKLAGPGLERAMRANQEAGMLLFKLRECPTVSVKGEGLRVTFFEPTMREELSLAVDLAVYEEQYQAAAENAELAELLRLPLGSRGFLQSDNVHHIPVSTTRRGIYVVGPGRGIMGREETGTDISVAVNEIQGLLGQGQAVAPQGRAVVDRGRCVLCLTCHRLCPHGAITWDNRAFINELACQGCGICASQCPNEAIQIRNCTDEQMTALFGALNPELSPRIVAFMCRNSAWEAYQTALKLNYAALPLGFTPVKMPCAGKVDVDYLLQAFNSGADGVLVLSCPQDNCKSSHGNLCAQWRVEQVQELLAEAGIDPNRLLFQSLAANAPGDFLNAVDQLVANLSRPAAEPDAEYPFWLTTGTMTHRYPSLYHENLDVFIEINPHDARQRGIQPGELIRTSSRRGTLAAKALLTDRVRPGTAFIPMHFLDDPVNRLISAVLDPITKLPEYQGCAVNFGKLVGQLQEVFGFKVPTSSYLHRGHTWVSLEQGGRVRIGLDDFSQKLLGRADAIRLPEIGQEIRREEVALTLTRRGNQAAVLAPLDGIVEAVNPKVLKRAGLAHDDPYGDGWLMVIASTNLQPDLENLALGEDNLAWIEDESNRLVAMLEPSVGATLQSGGTIIDDVYGHYPKLGWELLVKEFLRSA
ncbi:MAG: hydrogenase iron-sulfur subunit [Desulfobaccales bacterium]